MCNFKSATRNCTCCAICVTWYTRAGIKYYCSLQQADAILLGRHGAMTVDVSSYDAVLKSAYLEELAEIYYHTLLVNGLQEPKVFSGEELARWSYPQVIR